MQVGNTAGRLKDFYFIWAGITSDKSVLSSIKGFKIPFNNTPHQISTPREPNWSLKEIQDLQISIDKFLNIGALSMVEPCKGQFLSNIFLAPKSDGSNRLIINLKSLNKYVRSDHFKIEDHKTVIRLVNKNCFMATLDLKDAYTLVPISKSSKKCLRFKFRGKVYEYNCLPFGLNCAPLCFTKLMKPVIGSLRSRGWVSVIYLDDILLIGESYSNCQDNVLESKAMLQSLGFIINESKSNMVPSQRRKYLGFIYDSVQMSVSLPTKKRDNITMLVNKIQSQSSCKILDFAKFIGTLTSACPAVSYGWLYTKSFEREKYLALQKSHKNYDSHMTISSHLSEDFQWWLSTISSAKNSIKPLNFEIEIFSDASLTGWGIYCENNRSHGLWSVMERANHINYLELLAAFFGLKCFASHLQNCNILCRIDNTTAISYINRFGSVRFPHLNSLTREIWRWCEQRNLYIFASYINSKENLEADQESRKLEIETEWELHDSAFKIILAYFPAPEVDLFASRNNKKCRKFVSWLRDPEAWAVDAFTLDWSKFYFYAFPPFALISRSLQKIKSDKAEGILIVPKWTTQPWYPVFLSLLIKPQIIFNPDKKLLLSFDRTPHLLWPQLTLVAGALSYRRCS